MNPPLGADSQSLPRMAGRGQGDRRGQEDQRHYHRGHRGTWGNTVNPNEGAPSVIS
jgi:hypothetical protein